MNFKYKIEIKNRLPEYLQMTRNINTNKLFKCISTNHVDEKPSMGCKYGIIHCFTCGFKSDIYNLIGQDYVLSTFKEQYEKACIIFNYSDEFVKAQYKKNMKEIKNNIADMRIIEEQKEKKYNDFCDKLISKKNKFENAIKVLSNCNYKDSAAYQDYKFKVDFIDRFLNQVLEFNEESLNLIKDFNKLFEYEYSQFKKVLEVI